MSRYFCFGVVVLVLTGTRALAQVDVATTPHPVLTLRAAAEETLARNPELVALRQEYEAARAVPETERHLMPPMAEVQIWGWPVTTLNPARTDMYMFMGEQELPGRGKRAARALVAERDADMSGRQIDVRAIQIINDVKQAYIDLLVTRETFDVYASQTRLLQDMADAATSRYAAGEGPQHHTIATVVELAQLERERIAADARAQAAETRLNALLGRPASQPVETLEAPEAAVAPEDVERRALARRPEVAVVAAAVAREEAELARLRGERRPDYVVGGGYMLQPGGAGAWTARAGLTWPNAPWARGRLNAQIDVQARRVEAAKARGNVVAAGLRQAVRDATVRLNAAEREVTLIESTVLPQIEHTFELARLGYAAGESTFSDILDARRLLLSTQLESVEARGNVARARAALDAIAGVL